jgi:hypothetical protein
LTKQPINKGFNMGAVSILTPVVIAAWPAFSAAVVAAATSMGYSVAREIEQNRSSGPNLPERVELEIPQSELVMDQLGREQRLSVTRDGVTVTFSRDARGRAALTVTGKGRTEEALRAMGEELSQRVVQHHVLQKLRHEMQARQFLVVEEQMDVQQAVHMKIRHWEN